MISIPNKKGSNQTFAVKLKVLFNRLLKPEIILGIILLGVLGLLVMAPMVSLLHTTFVVRIMDRVPGAKAGDLTLYHWQRMITSFELFFRPLLRSLTIAVGTSVVALAIGSIFAWLIAKTDIPFKPFLSFLVVVPYILPSWALALPWVEFFKNRSMNMPPGLLEYWTGIQVPEWIVYGPLPIILVMGLHYYPFVYTLMSSALVNLDSQVEEAGELLGASRWRVLRTITLPAVLPAILSAVLLAFARTIGSFGTPALLGMPVNYSVLSVQMLSFLRMNLAARGFILATILILISLVLLYANNRYIGTRKSFELIGGKGFKVNLVKLGKARLPAGILALAFLFVFVVTPLGLLIWTSFMQNSGSYGLNNFTWHYWIGKANTGLAQGQPGVLNNARLWNSAWNSIKVASMGGLICSILGILIGYVVVRKKGTLLSSTLERVSFLPMLVPSIAFGAVYLSLFGVPRGPIPALYGSMAILVLVTVGKQLPFTARSGITSMHQIAGELEEASKIAGASWLQRFRDILWPLTMKGFFAGFLIVFITTMRELSLFVLLISPRTQLLTTLTFEYAEIGSRQLSNALMTLLIMIVVAVSGIVKIIENFIARDKKSTR